MLPASIFRTPGRRSWGNRGYLDADDEFAGLPIAAYSTNEWMEPVVAPSFGFLTIGGKKAGTKDVVTTLFLLL